jgi:hypothetical protein
LNASIVTHIDLDGHAVIEKATRKKAPFPTCFARLAAIRQMTSDDIGKLNARRRGRRGRPHSAAGR